MNKYEKLIMALQCNGDGIAEEADGLGCANKKCKYRDTDGACDLLSMTLDAVAAITALQAENGELREENGCLQHNVAAMEARLDQQAKNCEELLAEKDREIERLKSELLEAREDYMASEMEREQGLAAITRVEAERDAAIGDISHVCATCGQFEDGACPVLAYKDYPKDCDHWEWRGAQGEGPG